MVEGMGYAGTAGMVWGWIISMVFIQCVAMSMAELCSAMPTRYDESTSVRRQLEQADGREIFTAADSTMPRRFSHLLDTAPSPPGSLDGPAG